ncbi:hypothetical protein SEA_APIARY_19 [Rhodococcus phage Apiary]|nr:hypothetical protein SEA_BRAXOADDIE_19 [Rhodococcus phage Braxoaddie]WNM64942.1 hypothetical protein SEA_MASELOP_19 [Rhodococcus phage Maselop]WNM67403.1 hypothetical protein SEA_POLYYUKI_19 [Rhodococcus phage Polyyuki]WNM69827.1 hypothetical protein SEA_APIARY_19 [Rhodococcus phage Apiary]
MDQLVKQLTDLSTKVTAGVLRRIADALDTAEAGVEPVSVHVHIEHYHHTELPDKTVRLPWQKASK